MGMAFDTMTVFLQIVEDWGLESAQRLARSPITNLCTQKSPSPAYFDLELSRSDANGVGRGGHFLFDQHARGMEAIEKAPKLERIRYDHWTLALDGM
ncbi:hypothetical protein GY45DRAFT_1326357 [Cubamyces sp. BRFM 1775]|nr:hypothetical protein GY45DRAFT_1326357 [Cubamyces sp. BRFM 1775]